jgi:hypothetical protein
MKINILEDIKDIAKDDREHRITIEANCVEIRVCLEYDPDMNFNEKCIIPIVYDILDEFAYIPDSEMREEWNPSDYGIDYHEVCLIKDIMEYLESHREEIKVLCYGLDLNKGYEEKQIGEE